MSADRSGVALPTRATVARLWSTLRDGPILRNVGGAVAVQLALIVSGTLSARILGPTNRGYLAIFTTCSSTIAQVGAVGLSIAASYYLASGRISGREVVSLLRIPAAIQVATLLTIYAVTVFSYTLISGAPLLLVALITLPLLPAGLAQDYGIALALGGRRHGLVNAVRVLAPISYALGLVYLFVRGDGTLSSVVLIIVMSTIFGGTVALALGLTIANSIRPRESLVATVGRKAARSEIIAFGRHGYVGYLAPTDTLRIDQLLVGFLLAPHVLGLYVVGAAFTNFTRMVAVNVGLSGTTEVALQASAAAQRTILRHTLALSALLITGITIGVGCVVVVAIPLLFGSAFRSSVPIAECLLVATSFLALKRITVDLMRGAGEPRAGTRAEVINLSAFLVLGVPAALTFGGVGVAAALAISAACGSIYLALKMRHRGFL
jgi:O-antigen/teichoic acid export membrane protein